MNATAMKSELNCTWVREKIAERGLTQEVERAARARVARAIVAVRLSETRRTAGSR